MTENQYSQAYYHMFSKIVGCAFKAYNFYHNDVDELTYEAGLYMKLQNFRYGMLINFSPTGVYSENWMLDEEKGKCVRV